MAKLYIYNATVQFRDFVALIPETTNTLRVKIRPGHQAMVYEGSQYIIDSFIQQNEVYGLVRENEVKGLKPEKMVSMVYQLDAPIKIDAMKGAARHNEARLTDWGAEIRENVANYAQASIAQTMMQAGEDSKGMQIEIKDMTKENPTFHEVYAPEAPKQIDGVKPRRGRPKK